MVPGEKAKFAIVTVVSLWALASRLPPRSPITARVESIRCRIAGTCIDISSISPARLGSRTTRSRAVRVDGVSTQDGEDRMLANAAKLAVKLQSVEADFVVTRDRIGATAAVPAQHLRRQRHFGRAFFVEREVCDVAAELLEEPGAFRSGEEPVELLLEVAVGHGQLEGIEPAADERGKLFDADSVLKCIDRKAIVDLPDLKLITQFHRRNVEHGLHSHPSLRIRLYRRGSARRAMMPTDLRGPVCRRQPAQVERWNGNSEVSDR